jgi:type III secretion protein L
MVFIFPNDSQSMTPEHKGKVIRKTDFWAHRLAEDIVHEAFQRHQSIVHAAEKALVEEKERGYKEGREKAEVEKSRQMLDVINKTVSYSIAVEQQISLLVYNAVKQIISDFSDKEKTLSVVKSAMAAMRGQKHITLKVNPENVATLETELKNFQQLFLSVNHIEVSGQANIPIDSCIVSTEIGSAEASISGQLKALRDSISKVFGTQDKMDESPALLQD